MENIYAIMNREYLFSVLKDKGGVEYIKALAGVVVNEPSLQNDEVIIELSDQFGIMEHEVFNALVYLAHKQLLNLSVDEVYEVWFSYFLAT